MATVSNSAPTEGQWLSSQWHDRLGRMLAGGRKAAALAFLEDTIVASLPLFAADSSEFESRRAAWLIRAQLLLEWGRPTEALAWTCLECQLAERGGGEAPADAKALRDRLLRQLSAEPPAVAAARLASESQWPGILGLHELKASLERNVISAVRYPEDAVRHGVTPPNGILLYGPPGCGKSLVARKIAEKLGLEFLEVQPGAAPAPASAPTVLYFEAAEAFAPSELLARLAAGMRVIAATNFPDQLDPELLQPGRLEQHYLVGLPDLNVRAELFRRCLENQVVRSDLTWYGLATQTEGFTAADVVFFCEEMARLALAESKRLLVWEDPRICPMHFDIAVRLRQPAVMERHTRIGARREGYHA